MTSQALGRGLSLCLWTALFLASGSAWCCLGRRVGGRVVWGLTDTDGKLIKLQIALPLQNGHLVITSIIHSSVPPTCTVTSPSLHTTFNWVITLILNSGVPYACANVTSADPICGTSLPLAAGRRITTSLISSQPEVNPKGLLPLEAARWRYFHVAKSRGENPPRNDGIWREKSDGPMELVLQGLYAWAESRLCCEGMTREWMSSQGGGSSRNVMH